MFVMIVSLRVLHGVYDSKQITILIRSRNIKYFYMLFHIRKSRLLVNSTLKKRRYATLEILLLASV